MLHVCMYMNDLLFELHARFYALETEEREKFAACL